MDVGACDESARILARNWSRGMSPICRLPVAAVSAVTGMPVTPGKENDFPTQTVMIVVVSVIVLLIILIVVLVLVVSRRNRRGQYVLFKCIRERVQL